MSQRQQYVATLRQKRRDAGFRPLEVWLEKDIIKQIDDLKLGEESRDAVISRLLASKLKQLSQQRPEAGAVSMS
ncbi:hypothetical protein D6851_15655 [Altericroceibacterium spongiae]|uniref:Ribbon-helix-helix protein, CopG family n=1 Tax=Altericroceibacterium spongiae TaxID=2320269 RepID=A0A420EAJ5_9SPHN|nr:hypothetical protein [Altericroceibacterium spongiae]RKF17695.1 hypothetical protein D6851_15655 [Altericroceibacterium spongiae]